MLKKDLARVILFTITASYFYVFMEWLFFCYEALFLLSS
jgi:hypothetical protein